MFLDNLYHALNPVALQLGPFTIYWYGIAYVAGAVVAGIVMYRVAVRWGLDITSDDAYSVVIGVMFGIIVGARLFYVIFYGDGYYLEHPLEVFFTWDGGMSFHGGLTGGLIGGFLTCKFLKISFLTTCDLCFIGVPWGLFFGRCANFVNGELWGKETDLPWGVIFDGGGGVYRHPSQLYEAILEGLVIFAVLWTLSRKVPPRPQGTFLGTFLVLYAIFRVLIEFVRVPDVQLGYLFGWVTMGQLLCVPVFCAGMGLLWWAHTYRHSQTGHISSLNSR